MADLASLEHNLTSDIVLGTPDSQQREERDYDLCNGTTT